MKTCNPIYLRSPRTAFAPDATQSPPEFARYLLAAILGLTLLWASDGRAATPAYITSAAKVPFNSLVRIEKTTAPEWVMFSGNLDVISEIAAPSGICTPDAPCSLDGHILAITPGISGTGLTSGQKYHMLGLSLVKGNVQVPGTTVIQPQLVLVPPCTIKPVGRAMLTVPVQTIVTFNSSGRILRAAAPPTGLAAWWQAEGTAADALGANPGALSATGPVTFVPGVVGQAFRFNGAGYVEVPSSPKLEPTTVTATAWVRASNFPAPLFSYILSKGASGCDGASYALYTGANGGLQFYVSDGTTFSVSPDAGLGVWDGNWHFVAGTFDGATVRLYVDGVEAGTGTPSSITINYQFPDNDNFYIGTYRGSCELPFTGDVDEVQVFGRALTAIELQGLYNAYH